jgi:hypothetical protein
MPIHTYIRVSNMPIHTYIRSPRASYVPSPHRWHLHVLIGITMHTLCVSIYAHTHTTRVFSRRRIIRHIVVIYELHVIPTSVDVFFCADVMFNSSTRASICWSKFVSASLVSPLDCTCRAAALNVWAASFRFKASTWKNSAPHPRGRRGSAFFFFFFSGV